MRGPRAYGNNAGLRVIHRNKAIRRPTPTVSRGRSAISSRTCYDRAWRLGEGKGGRDAAIASPVACRAVLTDVGIVY